MEARRVRHLIGGEWRGDSDSERRNPADPDDIVAVTSMGSSSESALAVDAAYGAQPEWAAMPPPSRGAVLSRASNILADRADEVARDLTREEGKTLTESRNEVQRAIDVLRYFGGEGWRSSGTTPPAGNASTLIYTKREPLGIAAIITPWNFPVAIPAWKMAPALVSGNAVVLKPSELASLAGQHLGSALVDAGLPPGVLNILHGRGPEVGQALVNDARVDAISFTGSRAVGERIHAAGASRMARVQLEMGGKNAIVVDESTDLRNAASIIAASAFGVTGQSCLAASRLIVPSGKGDELVARIGEEASSFQPGNGLRPGVKMGPIVSQDQLETVLGYIGIAKKEGGEIIFGSDSAEGLMLQPVVVRGVDRHHTLAQEEVFGPVLAVIESSDFDESVQIVNDTPYGLTAGLLTNSLRNAHRFAESVVAGVVKINQPTVGLDLNVPFGGIKASSTGTFREQGQTASEFYTWSKSVYIGYDSQG